MSQICFIHTEWHRSPGGCPARELLFHWSFKCLPQLLGKPQVQHWDITLIYLPKREVGAREVRSRTWLFIASFLEALVPGAVPYLGHQNRCNKTEPRRLHVPVLASTRHPHSPRVRQKCRDIFTKINTEVSSALRGNAYFKWNLWGHVYDTESGVDNRLCAKLVHLKKILVVKQLTSFISP